MSHNSDKMPLDDDHFRRNSKEYTVHIEDPEKQSRHTDSTAVALEHPIEHYTRFPNRWTRFRCVAHFFLLCMPS